MNMHMYMYSSIYLSTPHPNHNYSHDLNSPFPQRNPYLYLVFPQKSTHLLNKSSYSYTQSNSDTLQFS